MTEMRKETVVLKKLCFCMIRIRKETNYVYYISNLKIHADCFQLKYDSLKE